MESPSNPKMTIDYAEWPRDAPSALERNVITIICGNTRLHWALHEGCMNKFIPVMFWYTMHDSEQQQQDDDEDEFDWNDPCSMLEAHIAGPVHTLIFGGPPGKNVGEPFGNYTGDTKSISKTTALRDAPGISVFVVSSNPRQEHKICHMFRDVPAKLFKLRNIDFFTAEQGVYPTMGVDRCAALYGAKSHYGLPALVIDGGTAMTYTMLDAKGVIQGGGISPGVKVRLQSLADYTGSLPTINHTMFKTAVDEAIETKTPIPFFAKDTQTAMIAPVCAELSCQLRNIIKQYVSKCQSSPSAATETSNISSTSSLISAEGEETAEDASKQSQTKRYSVVITGGDGLFIHSLLQNDASNIISVEPDASPIQKHNVDIKHIKNIVTYGLGALIYEKYSQKKKNPEEKLRLKIQGLRIAAPAIDQKELFSRGCVFNITPKDRIEGYIFHARFDNGIQKDLTLSELYDALVLYNEIGELPDEIFKMDEDWVAEKKLWSKQVQEELGNVSRLIRNRMRQLKPHMEKGELAEIFQKWSSIESRRNSAGKNKKAKLSNANPKDLVGKRLAKLFPIDIGGAVGDQIFFGTIKYISHNRHKWFFVSYDDGDSEDLNMEEVIEGIDLYEVHKFSDTIHKDNVENSNVIGVDAEESPEQENSKPTIGNAAEDDGTTNYTDLSTLLGLSSSSADINANERRISEFKEDI